MDVATADVVFAVVDPRGLHANGRLVADLAKATEAPGWVGWRVGSMGLDLDQKTFTVYVDDCVLSRVRVGPTGLLAM